MVDLLELAERCEQATGPDRELDAAIVVALDIRPDWVSKAGELWVDTDSLSDPVIRWNTLGKRSQGNPPIGSYAPFTASIDAAMSLVPEGREWRVRWCELPDGTWASIARIGENGCGLNTSAATPALALCAAALRARATLSEDAK